MYVCLSVTGLQLKYTDLRIVYVPFCHMPLMMQSRDGYFEVEDLEDRIRRQNKFRRWLTTQRKDERQDNGDRR